MKKIEIFKQKKDNRFKMFVSEVSRKKDGSPEKKIIVKIPNILEAHYLDDSRVVMTRAIKDKNKQDVYYNTLLEVGPNGVKEGAFCKGYNKTVPFLGRENNAILVFLSDPDSNSGLPKQRVVRINSDIASGLVGVPASDKSMAVDYGNGVPPVLDNRNMTLDIKKHDYDKERRNEFSKENGLDQGEVISNYKYRFFDVDGGMILYNVEKDKNGKFTLRLQRQGERFSKREESRLPVESQDVLLLGHRNHKRADHLEFDVMQLTKENNRLFVKIKSAIMFSDQYQGSASECQLKEPFISRQKKGACFTKKIAQKCIIGECLPNDDSYPVFNYDKEKDTYRIDVENKNGTRASVSIEDILALNKEMQKIEKTTDFKKKCVLPSSKLRYMGVQAPDRAFYDPKEDKKRSPVLRASEERKPDLLTHNNSIVPRSGNTKSSTSSALSSPLERVAGSLALARFFGQIILPKKLDQFKKEDVLAKEKIEQATSAYDFSQSTDGLWKQLHNDRVSGRKSRKKGGRKKRETHESDMFLDENFDFTEKESNTGYFSNIWKRMQNFTQDSLESLQYIKKTTMNILGSMFNGMFGVTELAEAISDEDQDLMFGHEVLDNSIEEVELYDMPTKNINTRLVSRDMVESKELLGSGLGSGEDWEYSGAGGLMAKSDEASGSGSDSGLGDDQDQEFDEKDSDFDFEKTTSSIKKETPTITTPVVTTPATIASTTTTNSDPMTDIYEASGSGSDSGLGDDQDQEFDEKDSDFDFEKTAPSIKKETLTTTTTTTPTTMASTTTINSDSMAGAHEASGSGSDSRLGDDQDQGSDKASGDYGEINEDQEFEKKPLSESIKDKMFATNLTKTMSEKISPKEENREIINT